MLISFARTRAISGDQLLPSQQLRRYPDGRATGGFSVVVGWWRGPDESETCLPLEDVAVLYVVGFPLPRQTIFARVRIKVSALMLKIVC